MSSQPLALSLVPAELPDWILALKPPDADLAGPTESAVFIGLDTQLELPMQTNPGDRLALRFAAALSAALFQRVNV